MEVISWKQDQSASFNWFKQQDGSQRLMQRPLLKPVMCISLETLGLRSFPALTPAFLKTRPPPPFTHILLSLTYLAWRQSRKERTSLSSRYIIHKMICLKRIHILSALKLQTASWGSPYRCTGISGPHVENKCRAIPVGCWFLDSQKELLICGRIWVRLDSFLSTANFADSVLYLRKSSSTLGYS